MAPEANNNIGLVRRGNVGGNDLLSSSTSPNDDGNDEHDTSRTATTSIVASSLSVINKPVGMQADMNTTLMKSLDDTTENEERVMLTGKMEASTDDDDASAGAASLLEEGGEGMMDIEEALLMLQETSRHRRPRSVLVTACCSFYREHCIYLIPMLGWFFFSAVLSSYNKIIFGKDHVNFPCPLLLTSMHFSLQWMLSYAITTLWPETFGGTRVRNMSWSEFLWTSIPCGLVTSGDIGLSNLSLISISITFYTMVKSSTPIFVLLWAYIFRIERITWGLLGVVAIIAIGEFFTVVGEVQFDFVGFLMCLGASVLSGARWTLVQLKIHTLDPPLKTVFATMRVLSPSMFGSMFLLSLAVEEPWIRLSEYLAPKDGSSAGIDEEALYQILHFGLLGGGCAFLMILCEFYLIMHASAIVLMIGGVIKELITITVGVLYFQDDLNGVNITGCAIVFSGVVLYKIQFHLARKKRTNEEHADALEYDAVTQEMSDAYPDKNSQQDEDGGGDDDDEEQGELEYDTRFEIA